MDEQEWYAQTSAGKREALLQRAREIVAILMSDVSNPVVAEAIRELQGMIARLEAASATPSIEDVLEIVGRLRREAGLN